MTAQQDCHNLIEILSGMQLKIRLILALNELTAPGISREEVLERSMSINELYMEILSFARREPFIARMLGYDANRVGWLPGTDFGGKWLAPYIAAFA